MKKRQIDQYTYKTQNTKTHHTLFVCLFPKQNHFFIVVAAMMIRYNQLPILYIFFSVLILFCFAIFVVVALLDVDCCIKEINKIGREKLFCLSS